MQTKFIFAASRILGLYPYDGEGLSTIWLLISVALQFGTAAAYVLSFIDIYPRNKPINLSIYVDFALLAVQFLTTNLHFFRAILDRRVFDSTKSASKRKGTYWVDFATVSEIMWQVFLIAIPAVLTDRKHSVWKLVTYNLSTLTYLIVLQYISSVSIKSLETKKLRRYIGKYPESACLHLYKIADQVEDIHRAYSPQLIFVLMKTVTAAVYFGFKALTSGSPLVQGLYLGGLLENLAWVLFIQWTCSSFSQQKKMCLYATIERKVEFRTCGFLALGNPLFTSTIAATTTYLVILLQFK